MRQPARQVQRVQQVQGGVERIMATLCIKAHREDAITTIPMEIKPMWIVIYATARVTPFVLVVDEGQYPNEIITGDQ